MNKNITHIKPIIEPEIKQYQISKIKKIEPYHDMYYMHINLEPNFIYKKVKLDNPSNIEKAKNYDDIPDGVTFENKLPDAYYQYKFKNKKSIDFQLSNIEAQNDIPNELNYLVMNEATNIPIPELKRENLDRENHLKILLAKHERKQSKYTDTTTNLIKDKDTHVYNKRKDHIKKDYIVTRPSTYVVNKPVIKPVSTTAPIIAPITAPIIAPVIAPVIAAPATIQPLIIPTSPSKRMLVHSPSQSRQASPPKIMLTSQPSQTVQKSSKSKQAIAQTNLPSPRQKQTVSIAKKVNEIPTLQNIYPPTPEIFGKSDILDSSTNLPEPPIKGRGRPAAKQHDNETTEQYNARILRNEKAVTSRKAKSALKKFTPDAATKLMERYIKLFGDRPLIQKVQKY